MKTIKSRTVMMFVVFAMILLSMCGCANRITLNNQKVALESKTTFMGFYKLTPQIAAKRDQAFHYSQHSGSYTVGNTVYTYSSFHSSNYSSLPKNELGLEKLKVSIKKHIAMAVR